MILKGVKTKVKKLKPNQQMPEQTTARIKAALERVRDKNRIILATVPSSKAGKPPYPITLGSNGVVWCPCDGFKFRSDCRHMDRFRKEVKTQVLL